MIDVKASVGLTYKFEVDNAKTEELGKFWVDVTLYTNPGKYIKQITKTLKKVKLETGQVFTNAAINNIILTLRKAWNNPGTIT